MKLKIGDIVRVKKETHNYNPLIIRGQIGRIIDCDYYNINRVYGIEFDFIDKALLHNCRGKGKKNQCDYVFEQDLELMPKEETEWCLKYHKTKTLYFEPPTFEDFLKTGDDKRFPHWDCDDISIVEWTDENRFLVDMYGDRDVDKFFYYGNDDWKDNRKEAYCKAVEYAMKLFLGEEI